LLFHDHLKKICIGVIVEVNNLLKIVFSFVYENVKKTFDNLSFTTSSLTAKHWTMVDLDELFDKELS